MYKREVFNELFKRFLEPRKFMQVLIGPRQVGKTTLALQLTKELPLPCLYISADSATLEDLSWLEKQWELARQKAFTHKKALLILDEVQKIDKWSDLIKTLWDEDTKNETDLYILLLGSSPWLVQKGLSESLAGRFEITPVTHWSFAEMEKSFGYDLDTYMYFGGYPGAASLVDKTDATRWKNYINNSLIETTISRDILLMSQINKPALLRRLFFLGCQYSGQVLSYSKMLGELQDAGNTTTLAHYLDLLCGAGLLCGIQKYANQPFRQKASSPKFLVANTALISATGSKSFTETKENLSYLGHLVESTVGAHILNEAKKYNILSFYWREGPFEVDFVLQKDERLVALEVKSNSDTLKKSGMDFFIKKFQPARALLIGKKGISLEDFLKTPLTDFFN